MKRINELVYVFCLLFLLFGCKPSRKGNNEETVLPKKEQVCFPLIFNTEKEYPVKEYRLEDIAEISYIPLETPEGKILGHTSPARWSVTKSDIFLGDLSAIFRFDKNGRFLNTIGKKGHGPGEYTFMHSFCVNEQKREIYITAGFQKQILIYTYEGEYKYSILTDNIYSPVLFDSLSLIVCKSLTPYNDVFLSVSPYELISLKDGRLLDSILPAPSENPIPTGTQRIMRSLKHVLKFRDEYILTHYSQDTVFTLKQDGRLVPRYIKEPSNVSLAASRWFYDFFKSLSINLSFTISYASCGLNIIPGRNSSWESVRKSASCIFSSMLRINCLCVGGCSTTKPTYLL